MDKFVVKLPKSNSKPSPKSNQPPLKQATLTDMKRVVVVGEIERIKAKLEANEDKDVLLECLNALSEKIPSRKILVETKIGRTVKRLCTHEDDQVRRLSHRLCQKWNRFFLEQDRRAPVEVQSDRATTKVREAARSFIAQALRQEEEEEEESNLSQLAKTVECELFEQCQKLVGKRYRRVSRKLIFALKAEETRRKLKESQISPKELVNEIILTMPKEPTSLK